MQSIINNIKYIKYFFLTSAILIPFLPVFVKGLGKDLGGVSLNLLLLSLVIGPLGKIFKNKVFEFLMLIRGEIGILMASTAIGHGMSFLVNPIFQKNLSEANFKILFTDMLPLTLGMLALFLTIPLLITSNIYLKQKMGSWWFRMHKLAYAIFILAALHAATIKGGFTFENILQVIPMFVIYGLIVLASKKWGKN
jgi:methionine sulfoxide reductase heme-binding subunit